MNETKKRWTKLGMLAMGVRACFSLEPGEVERGRWWQARPLPFEGKFASARRFVREKSARESRALGPDFLMTEGP